MDFSMDESIMDEFVSESLTLFEQIEADILKLFEQRDSPDRKLIDKIFRAVHSVKGASGFLGLDQIGKLSHSAETLLSALRSGELKPNKDITDALLEGADLLTLMLKDVRNSNKVDISATLTRLASLLEKSDSEDIRKDIRTEILFREADGNDVRFEISKANLKTILSNYDHLYVLGYDFTAIQKKGKSPVALIKGLLKNGVVADSVFRSDSYDLMEGLPEVSMKCTVLYSTSLCPQTICQTLGLDATDVMKVNEESLTNSDMSLFSVIPDHSESHKQSAAGIESDECIPEQPGNKPEEKTSGLPESGSRQEEPHEIRVDIGKVNSLITMVGELVIAESMVMRNTDPANFKRLNFKSSADNLRSIVNGLQELAMSMRMVPLSRIFRRIPRLIHDLSEKTGKKIRLKIFGEGTEVDRSIIEQLNDPMMHIIRNCADHGIENAEERKAKGKPEEGNIRIEANHEGSEMVICVSDDGQGLNRDVILCKGKELGLINKETEAEISDQDIGRLISESGFSTAREITDISGRGVGLDVVRRGIEKLNGRMEIRSEAGKGCTTILRIPLTLAVIDGILIRVGTTRFIIPLSSVKHTTFPNPDQIRRIMYQQEIVCLHDELIPVVRLCKLFDLASDKKERHRGVLIHVVSGSRSVCFFADEVIGFQKTVIKEIPKYVSKEIAKNVSSVRYFSGCTILGDGVVSLILDIAAIINTDTH